MWSLRHKLLSMTALIVSNSLLCAVAGESSLVLPTQTDGRIVLPIQFTPGNEKPTEYLQVFVGDQSECCAGRTPVAGNYSFNDEHGLIFEPVFDFIEGQTYTVSTMAEGRQEFVIQPESQIPVTEAVAIYPSGDELPENTLRFYLHFPVPVKPQVASQYVELHDANGVADHAAFMVFKQELWSEDRKRLTLLLDPGRIKRGVTQNLTLGPALSAGNQYSIVVKSGWPAAVGSRSLQGMEKRFQVTESLNTLPDISAWGAEVPGVFTRDRLVLQFDRSFDFELVQRAIRVVDGTGRVVSGEVLIGNREQQCQFQPHDVWATDEIQVVVDARLEDIAGNNFNELLDRPLPVKKSLAVEQRLTLKLTQPGEDT